MKISKLRIQKIGSLLEQELYIYDRLHKAAKSIQDLVVINDINMLNSMVEQEDALFARAELLRQERLQIMLELKDELNLSDSEFGLARLMEFMDEQDAREIHRLRDELLASISRLDTINRINHELVDYSLNLNAQFMNLLVNLGQNNPVYQKSGMLKQQANVARRLLDKKV
ncbi:MAG: flagellar export chaperone FlgN [Candidatus Auribacterota bacterium]|jgi:flagellar biosynthesis/type III secretory pathway chaperone|nr:flagellar export chaperone FlgN [Candidatus Auribacterota bacterium]